MTNEMLGYLEGLGVDWDKTMERFLENEEMFMKFFVKFAEDENYGILLESAKYGDKKKIETAAHTLKGVAGNLGLEEMQNIYSLIVDNVRGKDEPPLDFLIEKAKKSHSDFMNVVEKMKNLSDGSS